MSVLAGPHNADTVTEIYRVYPTGWSAARRAGLLLDDQFSVTVERLHRGPQWLVMRGVLFYDPEKQEFVDASFYAAKTPARFAYPCLDAALEVARGLVAATTNHRRRTFAEIVAAAGHAELPTSRPAA